MPMATSDVSSNKFKVRFCYHAWTSTVSSSPFWLPSDRPNTLKSVKFGMCEECLIVKSLEMGWHTEQRPPK